VNEELEGVWEEAVVENSAGMFLKLARKTKRKRELSVRIVCLRTGI
jgi:hypothetical protein